MALVSLKLMVIMTVVTTTAKNKDYEEAADIQQGQNSSILSRFRRSNVLMDMVYNIYDTAVGTIRTQRNKMKEIVLDTLGVSTTESSKTVKPLSEYRDASSEAWRVYRQKMSQQADEYTKEVKKGPRKDHFDLKIK